MNLGEYLTKFLLDELQAGLLGVARSETVIVVQMILASLQSGQFSTTNRTSVHHGDEPFVLLEPEHEVPGGRD